MGRNLGSVETKMNTMNTNTKPLSKKAAKQQERDEAITRLRSYLKPGDTVYCVLRHVSRSGMQRRIDLYMIEAGQPLWLSSLAARAMDMRLSDQQGIIVGGCGMDMGFHLVYNLGRTLFPDGFGELGQGGLDEEGKPWTPRPETPDHAAVMVKAGVKFRGRNGDTSGWDNDGGYALKHSWI